MIYQKYHTVRTVPKSNRNIVEDEAKSIPLRYIYNDHSRLSWLSACTSIRNGGGKL